MLNFINRFIKLTMEKSDKELPFLDVLNKRNDDKMWMDIYFEPTDTRCCFPFSSSHPNHCKKNMAFTLARDLRVDFQIPTLARRICTIVENQQQKLRHLSELKGNLKKYYYPINKWYQESPSINSKRQPTNLKKLLTKVEFNSEEVGVRKCQDLRC